MTIGLLTVSKENILNGDGITMRSTVFIGRISGKGIPNDDYTETIEDLSLKDMKCLHAVIANVIAVEEAAQKGGI